MSASDGSGAATPGGNGGNGGGGSSLFPFTLVPSARGTVGEQPQEAVMPAPEVQAKWTQLFTAWHVTDNAEKTRIVEAVLLYLAVNGSSPRGNYDRSITTGRNTYPMRTFARVIGEDIRRFARAHADHTVETLRLPANKELAAKLALRYMVQERMGCYAFDFSDYATDLRPDEYDTVQQVRRHILATTQGYRQARPEGAENVSSLPVATPPPPSPYRAYGGPSA